MNQKRRIWIAVIVGIAIILLIISVIAYVIYDFAVLEFGHPPPWPSGTDLTATSIIAQTRTTITQVPIETLTPIQ